MNYTPHNFNQPVTRAKAVIEIKNDNTDILKEVYPKVIYFTAKWCGPCQRISPIYSSLAENNRGIKFFKVDVDNNEKLSEMFAVQSMPTFYFFRSKNDYKTFSGADENKLITYLSYLFN